MDLDISKYIDLMIELTLLYAPKVFLAGIVLYVGFRLVGLATQVMNKALRHEKVDESLASFLESLVSMGLKGLVIITVANMVGIQMTSFIALLGAAGLAVGLSLQGSLSNFAGGILILLFKPFKVGDMIEANGHLGKVSSIQIANTILKTTDNKTVIIPNGAISNGSIENYSTEEKRRLDMVFGIGYDDDIRQAKAVLDELISSNDKVLKEPGHLIVVSNLGASSVDIECRMWCDNADYHALRFEMNEQVKLTFDEQGISFPYPQQDVHLYQQVSSAPTLNQERSHAGIRPERKTAPVSTAEELILPADEGVAEEA